jgi:ATP synthase protein I
MSENQGGSGSFEERLRAARDRRGLDAPPPGQGQSPAGGSPSALGIGLRVGVELVSAMAVAVAIGWALDRWLHTTPVFICVFVLLGGAAGVMNVWRVMGPRPQRPR